MTTHIALFSGGKDSLVATHYSYQHFPIDFVAYLDTNSGLPENKEYVIDTCESHGWDLQIRRSPMQLEEFVQRHGFPGPAIHSWAFRYFKERQLGKMATEYGQAIYYSGVRQSESSRRNKNVRGKYGTDQRWDWVRPIHNFTENDCREYIETHDLRTNPLYDTIGRSGDCYCGAFAHRATELAELQEYYPEHYDWLTKIEKQAKQWDHDSPKDKWGWGGLTAAELRAELAQDDELQSTLCSNCDIGI